MATLPKVLISRADYQIGGGVALGLRTQASPSGYVDLTAMLLGLRAIIFCASSGVCARGRHGRLPSTSKVFSLARTCPTSKQKRRPQRRPPTFAHRVILVSDTTSRS